MKFEKMLRLLSAAAAFAVALLPASQASAQGQSAVFFPSLTGESVGVERAPASPSPSPGVSRINNYLFQDEQINLDANTGNVRVLRTDQKALMNDFITQTFPVSSVNPRELRNVLRTITGLEGGRAEVVPSPGPGFTGAVQVIAPAFMMPYLEEAIPLLDEVWVREFDTGSADVYYTAKNRSAAAIDFIAANYGSENGFSVIDTTNNASTRIDEPYRIENYLRGATTVDIPANQVLLEVKMYEIASSNDLKLGVDYINWKNGPGRHLLNFLYAGADAQSDNQTFTSIFDPFTNAGAALLTPGDEVELLTDFDQYYRSVNYLLTSNFVDFLQVRGKARVLRNESIMVKSANPAFIAADDQLVAPVSTGGDWDRSAITRIRLNAPGFDNGEGSGFSGTVIEEVDENGQIQPVFVGATSVNIPDTDRRLNNRTAGHTGVFLMAVPFVGLVSMELVLDVEVADLNGLAPNGQPIINSRTLSSTVRLLDGEPYVVGGIKRSHIIEETAKAPGLGDLPILGYLFGGENNVNRQSEVVIVVTPHFYLSAQTDVSAPRSVKHLAQVVEGKLGVPLPHNHMGFDQWLLDPDKTLENRMGDYDTGASE